MKRQLTDMEQALRAARKRSRDEEIAAYGHPICHAKVFRNRKKFNRKDKANRSGSPLFFGATSNEIGV